LGRLKTLLTLVALGLVTLSAGATKPKPVLPAQDRIDAAVEALYKQSDVFFHEGDYESSLFCYDTIVALDPHDIEAWTNYGWLLWSGMDRREQSRKTLQQAIAYNPNDWEVYAEMGNLQYHYRDFLDAAAWFYKAMGRGAPWTVWHQRAHSLEYAGRRQQCVETWQKIVAKFPDDGAAKQNLKRVREGRFRTEPVIGVVPRAGPIGPRGEEPPAIIPLGPQAPGSV
jgi:tetratricopeptide (TPR) repeat protein